MSETILGATRSVASRSTSERVGILNAVSPVMPRPFPIMVSATAQEAIGIDLRALAGTAGPPASANYPGAANTALFVPFGVAEVVTVVKMWVYNGAAIAGNVDVGIFNPDGTMIVHIGSTGQSGSANTIQEFDITDTVLQPGRYYLGISSDTSGVTQKIFAAPLANAGALSAMGVLQCASTFPLASCTFATCTAVAVPVFGISIRTLIL